MLKVEHKLNNKTTIVAEAETQLELFDQLSSMSEVFGESVCGKCKSENIHFRVRNVVDGKKQYYYPEMKCKDCHATLMFGQKEGGQLFPIRYERKDGEYVKDKDGKWIPRGSNGWAVYNKDSKDKK